MRSNIAHFRLRFNDGCAVAGIPAGRPLPSHRFGYPPFVGRLEMYEPAFGQIPSVLGGNALGLRYHWHMNRAIKPLPLTTMALMDDRKRPYFLWWTHATGRDLRAHLAAPDPDERAYWMGALLREANTRDVWLFVTPQEIRASWDRLVRHLGKTRDMWAFLLGLPAPIWPPSLASRTG
jgi:hypothetical protein